MSGEQADASLRAAPRNQADASLRAAPRSTFIPFRRSEVVAMCADELPEAERGSFLGFATMLNSLIHHRFHAHIEALKDAYHPFNAEALGRTRAEANGDERLAARRRLEEELAALAVAANFTELDVSELDRAFTEHSLLKVRLAVDMDVIDKVMVFRRGESVRVERVPLLFGLLRRTVEFPNYARVLVYAAFKDAEHFAGVNTDRLAFRPGSMIIKLFQNVPRNDLEMVLPNVKVGMRRVDKLLIGVPAFVSGAIVVATKLLAPLGLLLLLLAFWLGIRDEPVIIGQTALVSTGAGLVAFGAFLMRQVTKFMNRKIMFMKALSENLYFRNLDNDAGVFHHLLDAAEEAEAIEAVLAYHFLRVSPQPLTAAELDRMVEDWLARRLDAPVDFEVADGLRKLRELSLVTEDEPGRFGAVGLDEAKRRMDHAWDTVFDYNNPVCGDPRQTLSVQ
jgi:hypothetical protein